MADQSLDDYIRKKTPVNRPRNILQQGSRMPPRNGVARSNTQNRVKDAREDILMKKRNLGSSGVDARGVINARRQQQKSVTSTAVKDARQQINALRSKTTQSQQQQKPKDLRDVLNKKKPQAQVETEMPINPQGVLNNPSIQNKGGLFAKALAQSVRGDRQSSNIRVQVQEPFQIPAEDLQHLNKMRITRTLTSQQAALPPSQQKYVAVPVHQQQPLPQGQRMFVPAGAAAAAASPPLQMDVTAAAAPAPLTPTAPAAAAVQQQEHLASRRAAEMRHRIIVRNLPPSVSQDDLTQLFSEIGPLKGVKLLSTGGIAIATFVKYDDALTALAAYNKAKLDNCTLDIKMLSDTTTAVK